MEKFEALSIEELSSVRGGWGCDGACCEDCGSCGECQGTYDIAAGAKKPQGGGFNDEIEIIIEE